ncbi:MAG: hypothetical protein WKF89_18590 [Chitinophagaceae bacterium]
MNIINKFFLRVVLFPAPLYRKIGVNTHHLFLILTIKLMMDDRRPNTFQQARIRKPESVTLATLGTMLFSVILGLVFLTSFFLDSLIAQLTVYFSLFITMLALTLIADFTSVLIDVRDNVIILSKPVSDKTFVLSRLLHILIHVTKITLPMALPALVYMTVKMGGWAAVVLFFLILSATVLTIFLINIIYLVILKFTSPDRFRNIISYIQIGMTILIYACFQLVPRLASKLAIEDYPFFARPWIWIVPSYWYARSFEFFYFLRLQTSLVFSALITIVAPFFALWMVVKFFAPSFNQKLSLISAGSQESVSTETPGNSWWSKFVHHLASLFTKRGEERMGFILTWILTSRERDFKMKVYPSIGYLLVLAVVLFFNSEIDLTEIKGRAADARTPLISLLYSASLLLVLALSQLQYSEKFKAAWFYFTAPISRPGLILTGSLKASICKFLVPPILLIAIPALFFVGIAQLPNIMLAFSNMILGCIILSLITLRNLPFSAPQNTSQRAGALIRNFMSTLVIIFIALIHFLIYNFTWVVIISCILSLLANWLLLDHLKNRSWNEVLARYDEG